MEPSVSRTEFKRLKWHKEIDPYVGLDRHLGFVLQLATLLFWFTLTAYISLISSKQAGKKLKKT